MSKDRNLHGCIGRSQSMYKCMYLHIHGCTQHVNAYVFKSEWECSRIYPFFFLEWLYVCTWYICLWFHLICACMHMPSQMALFVHGMCKPPQVYNCSYTCIRAWTQIPACLCSHVHKCTFIVECRDWRREFSACLLANMVHNKCRKTINQGLEISNLRSTCASWSRPEQLKLRRLPRMMGEVPGF